jgi:hypothetical protein
MSFQVVNPATGEIAVMFPEKDGHGNSYLETAKEAAKAFNEKDHERWDVLEIKVLFSIGGDAA